MQLKTYFQLFWVPAIASVVLIALLSAQGVLPARTLLILVGWFVLAIAAQFLGPIASGMWVAGLALQTVLAVVLLLKHRVGQF
jgi:hypothetical protein